MKGWKVWNGSVERIVVAKSIREAEFQFNRKYDQCIGSCPVLETRSLRRRINKFLEWRKCGLKHGPEDWPFFLDEEDRE